MPSCALFGETMRNVPDMVRCRFSPVFTGSFRPSTTRTALAITMNKPYHSDSRYCSDARHIQVPCSIVGQSSSHVLTSRSMCHVGPLSRNMTFSSSHCLSIFNDHTNKLIITLPSQRMMSAKPQQKSAKTGISLSKDDPNAELTVGAKVARAGKDATYTGVVVVGVVITGLIFYTIGKELFSGQSPSGIYQRAFKECKKNDDIYVLFGAPLKAYGETNRRGRRRFTSHTEFVKDGVKCMRMKFYIEGPSLKGTVQLEAKQDEGGKYQFRYIFVEADTGLRGPIVVLDQR